MKNVLCATLFFMLPLGSHATCFDTTLKPSRTAEELFINSSTVVDLVTGLEWQRCAIGMTFDALSERCAGTPEKLTWDVALREAKAANVGTTSAQNWRIPNIKELRSAADTACYRPIVRPTVFPDTPSDAFWSSTPDPKSGIDRQAPLIYINFEDGLNYTPLFSGAAYVRLVRDLRP